MSYILEALKKAESERQLGAVPNVHAQTSNHADSQGRRSGPWIIGLLLLLAILLAALLWRSFATPAPPATSPSTSPATGAAPAIAIALPPSASASPPTQAPISTPSLAPGQAAMAASMAPTAPSIAVPPPAPAAAPVATPKVNPANPASPTAPALAATPVPHSSASVTSRSSGVEAVKPAEPLNNDLADEQLPFMAQLPEAIVREVPQVQIKGFIYSKTPAERSLLVGGNLYHEGDDVAPGVRLEKLLPRAAVMNYRGFRYRIGY